MNQKPQEAFNNFPLTMWKRSRQPHHVLGQPDLFLLSDWLSVVSAANRASANQQRVKNKKLCFVETLPVTLMKTIVRSKLTS